MKVCIAQPAYSADYAQSDAFFADALSYFDSCDESMDIIVFPEDSDQPCYCKNKEENDAAVAKYNKLLLTKAAETAKRCHAIVFVNARFPVGDRFRNTTYAFDREGKVVGTYDKQHLVASESNVMKLDDDYTFSPTFPTILTIEGIRFAFLTCYDFYFYENYSNIARFYPDVIIGCSHQRSDPQHVLETMSAFLAYNTNAYVFRASVSMGKNSTIGGGSMIAAPDGTVVLNMKSRVGIECAVVDLSKKFYKPCGYGNPPGSHFDYCEIGRRPYKYRPAGPFLARSNRKADYPRASSFDGFYQTAPKGSLCAVGAALSTDCTETMLSIYATRDHKAVILSDEQRKHKNAQSRTPESLSLAELFPDDFGAEYGEEFSALLPTTLEDVLKKYTCHTVFVLYLKTADGGCFDREALAEILRLVFLYDAKKYVIFAADNEKTLALLKELAPDLPHACAANGTFDSTLFLASQYGCERFYVQSLPDAEQIEKAHANGFTVGLFTDDKESMRAALLRGADILVSDRCRTVSHEVNAYKNARQTENRKDLIK